MIKCGHVLSSLYIFKAYRKEEKKLQSDKKQIYLRYYMFHLLKQNMLIKSTFENFP